MTTEQTTEGGTEMETEQKTNTVIGDIENQNTVIMTQQAYDAIGEQHSAALEQLNQRIGELNGALEESKSRGFDAFLRQKIQEIVATNEIDDDISEWMNDNANEHIEHWAENWLNGYIEDWASNYANDYIDTDDIAHTAAEYIDGNSILSDALYSMCDSGKQQVAELVNELIGNKRITLPVAPAAPAGLDQQAIYTALDQIRGGITTILAQMDANQPTEVTE